MPRPLPAGPFETLHLDDGTEVPVYLIPFDKRGRCKAPRTRKHLVEAAEGGDFTHLFLFSHGWNNTFETALRGYREFFGFFKEVREANQTPAEYRPLLVGVIWPSISLLMPWERPPRMRSLSPEPLAGADEVDETVEELDEIAAELPDADVERFYDLAGGSGELSDDEAKELAGILQPLYRAEDPDDDTEPPTEEELVEIWRLFGEVVAAEMPEAERSLSRGLDKLDPRNVIRAFTVWKMKDRAGKVGRQGVGPLLNDLIAASDASPHLIGHSYGAKVVLSAAASLPEGSDGKVSSALLLQPAINGWAFAGDVAGKGFPGGYRRVLSIVSQPILTTFSRHDVPLTKLFHLAVRRKGDLGETRELARKPRFGALGGFGPQGTPTPEGQEIRMPGNGSAYPEFQAGNEVIGLQGDEFIDGHGGVRNLDTAWALYNQVVRAG